MDANADSYDRFLAFANVFLFPLRSLSRKIERCQQYQLVIEFRNSDTVSACRVSPPQRHQLFEFRRTNASVHNGAPIRGMLVVIVEIALIPKDFSAL